MLQSIRKITAPSLFALVFLFGLTTTSCGDSHKPEQNSASTQASAGVPLEISLAEFDQKFKADKAIKILDVRTPEEYEEFHTVGSVLLPLQEIMSLGDKVTEKMPFSKEDTIYVICRSGNRSFTATRILRSQGYANAISVQGGTAGFVRIGNECGAGFLACAH